MFKINLYLIRKNLLSSPYGQGLWTIKYFKLGSFCLKHVDIVIIISNSNKFIFKTNFFFCLNRFIVAN